MQISYETVSNAHVHQLTVSLQLKYLHNIKHCGMHILDIKNLQLSHDNFDVSINDLNRENNV